MKSSKETVDQLHSVLYRYCLSLAKNRWDAEDLAQESWARVLRSRQNQQTHPNLQALLLRIARNAWIDQGRKRKHHERWLEQEQRNTVPTTMPDHDSLEGALHALMQHLTPLQRGVFFLKDIYGYSAPEISKMLGLSEGAVKAALHRARKALANVQMTLEHNALVHTGDDGYKMLLGQMASSFMNGDIHAVVGLAMRDELDPAVALAVVQQRKEARARIPDRPRSMAA